ncbi:class III extradiol ring-cleavage dioxygenase family protein [Mycolicibacterium stellerae]|uniref:hypothetical protein n=1 Tax=Mycolicibacterium stellerae TaxID=2358193 RepID=UPI0013DDD4C0|nr:hypothetical protein [Mycolicibacterium stellerae]
MSWLRDEVLFRTQRGLFGLKAVRNLAYREDPDRSPEAIGEVTSELVRALLRDGLAVVGDRTESGFVKRSDPHNDLLDGTQETWLQLTEAGRLAANAVPVTKKERSPDSAVKQFGWPLLDAAREVLLYGTIDWVELGQIHWRVKEVSPDVPIEVVQQRTLQLIAELVEEELAVIGQIEKNADGLVPWNCSLEVALSRIRAFYVDRYDETAMWEWCCLLDLTRLGEKLAWEIEAQTAP